MKYQCTLLAVRDMERSRRFYETVLGLCVTADFGANVTMSDCVALQSLESWRVLLHKPEEGTVFGGNDAELYFEEDDFDGFCAGLAGMEIDYVHPPVEHRWGQRAVRFYDPDRHVIEVGENINSVVRRYSAQGLSDREVAARMDVPLEFVEQALQT